AVVTASRPHGRPAAERALERRLVTALLMEPDTFDAAAQRVAPEDFSETDLRGLAERLWTAPETLYTDEATGALARELVAAAESDMNWRAEAAGAARRLEQRRLKGRQRVIREAMSTTADFETIRALQAEALTIGNRLGELEREIGAGADSRATFPTETTGRS
ncbi:MAG: hypothetical protein HOP12_12570, partial [Candidatus Eisenbacteria bacterium]|nr:hypothetical protein [Candidatus Eisenbacteria bacterium]